MSARLLCIVPFCRCTTSADRIAPSSEWICQKHWRLVPRATKARWSQVKRRQARIHRKLQNTRYVTRPGPVNVWWTVRRQVVEMWERCKREAIEMAGGI